MSVVGTWLMVIGMFGAFISLWIFVGTFFYEDPRDEREPADEDS